MLIIKKEFLTALRDVRLQVSFGLLTILMLTAILVGRQGQQQLQEARTKAQATVYEQWLNQDRKNPHSAAHYGQMAFKPKPVLSFLDIGLDHYTGTAVYLEAHKQNEVLFSAAQDSNGMTRFGEMTVALILQVLLPLLIIFMTFNIFSKEREEGTLKLIHAQGISMRQLLMGKVWGTYLMVLLVVGPLLLLAYFLLDQEPARVDPAVTTKFLLLLAGYALYFLVVVLLCVLVSAFVKSSEFSLLTLLGVWIAACIILPKATTNLASKVYPTPSQFEFKKTIKDKVQNGIDGHNPYDVRLAALKQEMLDQYGVATIEELPVSWRGITLQAGEDYTDQVYDEEFSKVVTIFQQQNRLSEWAGFLNPYLAAKHFSMALAGTDFHHHVNFSEAAERYRRYFIKKMNKDIEVNQKPGMGRAYQVGKEIWATVEPFEYAYPSVGVILSQQWRSMAALGLWLVLLFGLAYFFGSKISIL